MLTKAVVTGSRERKRDGLNISLLLVIPGVLEVDVLDQIDMLLTEGLATLPALDLAMAPHKFSLLLSLSTRHRFLTGSSACFCLALHSLCSPLYSRLRRLEHLGTSGRIGVILPFWAIPLVIASLTVVGSLLTVFGSLM
jgi:hypothetical protein